MIWDTILLAVRELRRNLLRALLTTLGVVIGVASVIAMVTLGNGATASIAGSIGALGQNVMILQPGAPRGGLRGPAQGQTKPFDAGDVDAIRREIGHLRAITPQAQHSNLVVATNKNHTTNVTGTDREFFIVHSADVASGRIFTDAEVRAGRAVCILGETVRTVLFGSGNPVGTRVRVGGVPCDVIGVLASKGQSSFGQDQDDILLMPLRAVQRRLAGNNSIATIWLAADSAENIPRIIADTQQLMRERRRIAKGAEDDFAVNDLASITQTISQVTDILTLFLAAIAAVSLLVGGIGIMNIMLVSVTERTREIGIRLAIGAREKDVLLQFLVEAMMMSVLGGAVGIALGLALSGIGVTLLRIPFVPSIPMIFIAFIFSGCIGIAFGYFPARRAARLDPIEALRHE